MKLGRFLITFLLVSMLVGSFLLLAGCGKKAECESSSECAVIGNPCILGSCSDGKCVNRTKDDCCGNRKCDADASENKCTCAKDCGKCEGTIKYNVTSSGRQKVIETQYAQYICENTVCLISVNPADVNEERFLNEINLMRGFKADVITVMNNPFDIRKDKMKVTILVKYIDPQVVGPIISLPRIRVLSSVGKELMSPMDLTLNFNITKVGDTVTQEFPLTSSQKIPEESRTITVYVSYVYMTNTSGRISPPITEEAAIGLSKKITFITQ